MRQIEWHTAGLLVILTALFCASRIYPGWDLLTGAEPEWGLLGNDSYFHLRSIRFSTEHFPELLRWDAGTNFPEGEIAEYSGLFDLLSAATVLVISGSDPTDSELVRGSLILFVLLLSSLIPSLYLLARCFLPTLPALLVPALFLIHPGPSFDKTLVGFLDHHLLEMLLVILTLAGIVHCLHGNAPQDSAWWKRFDLISPLPLLVFTLSWPGAPVIEFLVGVSFSVVYISSHLRPAASLSKRVLESARQYGLGLAILMSLFLPFSDFVPTQTAFITTYLVSLWLAGVLPLLEWLLDRFNSAVILGFAGASAIGIMLALWKIGRSTPAFNLVRKLWRAKTLAVAEHVPFEFGTFLASYSLIGVLALLAIPYFLLASDAEIRSPQIAVATFVAVLLSVRIATYDYEYQLAPLIPLLAVILANRVWANTWLQGRLHHSSPFRMTTWILVGLFLGANMTISAYSRTWPWADNRTVNDLRIFDKNWQETALWFRKNTPAPPVSSTARVGPWEDDFHYPEGSYGILATWDAGNFVAAMTRRPVLQSQGIERRVSRWLLSQDGEEVWKQLNELCQSGESFRYLISDARTFGTSISGLALSAGHSPADFVKTIETSINSDGKVRMNERFYKSLLYRLHAENGTGTSHLRLVFASSGLAGTGLANFANSQETRIERKWRRYTVPLQPGQEIWAEALGGPDTTEVSPYVKVFELVPGARICGALRRENFDSTKVSVKGFIHSDGATPLLFEKQCELKSGGEFECIVPYSYNPPHSYRVSEYLLYEDIPEIGTHNLGRVRVHEQAVQSGGTVSLEPTGKKGRKH